MNNEEKAREIAIQNYCTNKRNMDISFKSAIEMAEWKDLQLPKWHKVSDGDLPIKGGNYWCKLKGNYQQGSSHYKQHCNDGYCILQWLANKQAWNVKYKTEVEAWIELPKIEN